MKVQRPREHSLLMSTKERANVFTGLHLSRPKSNAPFKAPTPTMPASRAAVNRQTQEMKQSHATINFSDDDIDTDAPPKSDSSDDDGPDRSNIVRTKFAPKGASANGPKGTRNSRFSKRTVEETISVHSASPRTSKRVKEDNEEDEKGNAQRLGSKMSDSLDFTKTSSSRPRRKPVKTFSTAARSAFGWTDKTHNANKLKRASQKSEQLGSCAHLKTLHIRIHLITSNRPR